MQPEHEGECSRVWDPGDTNEHTSSAIIAAANGIAHDGDGDGEVSRTELDSHANMPVVGKHSFVISDTGKTVSVSPFTPQYKPVTVKLVDAAIQYDGPLDGKSYILVVRNALYCPEMDHNLIPPFIMREAGIVVNDVPKIHTNDPSETDHAIIFEETGFRIPLALWGTFSYFPSKRPDVSELADPSDVYVLTPENWNPHSDVFASNEASYLDWEGNIRMRCDRQEQKIVLEDIFDGEADVAALSMPGNTTEERVIDNNFNSYDGDIRVELPCNIDDRLHASVANISALYDEQRLFNVLQERSEVSQFMVDIGATNLGTNTGYLFDQDGTDGPDAGDNSDCSSGGDNRSLEETLSDLDDEIDKYMSAASAVATDPRGVTPEHLAKCWRISIPDAARTIDVTTQHVKRPKDPSLSRNYTTNDRMLRYKRINQYFYTDTFFATKKGGKSSPVVRCL